MTPAKAIERAERDVRRAEAEVLSDAIAIGTDLQTDDFADPLWLQSLMQSVKSLDAAKRRLTQERRRATMAAKKKSGRKAGGR